MKTKRVISIVACMLMVLYLAACGGNNSGKKENVKIANPWTVCSDIKEAEKNAGFSFEIPETIKGYKISWTQNMDKEMIEVIYVKESEEDNSIHLRKGIGTEDISGDYNAYSESNQVDIGSYNVTMQGNNGSVSLATWTDGEFSYVVSVPEMSMENVATIIQQMK